MWTQCGPYKPDFIYVTWLYTFPPDKHGHALSPWISELTWTRWPSVLKYMCISVLPVHRSFGKELGDHYVSIILQLIYHAVGLGLKLAQNGELSRVLWVSVLTLCTCSSLLAASLNIKEHPVVAHQFCPWAQYNPITIFMISCETGFLGWPSGLWSLNELWQLGRATWPPLSSPHHPAETIQLRPVTEPPALDFDLQRKTL